MPGELAPIETRAIPKTGESLPIVGLGTWRTFDVGESDPQRAVLKDVLARFTAGGARLVDTSPMYGRAEEAVGSLAMEARRSSSLFLATKVWTTGKAAGLSQMEESLRRLRVKTLDLMQVHNLVDVETHLETLREWRAKNLVRYVGITHYVESAFPELERILETHRPDFIQFNYSIAERGAETRLLSQAASCGAAVLVNRPFGTGGLFDRVRGKALPAWAGEFGCSTWAQFFLKYVLGHPSVTCAIPATANPDHLVENLAAGRPPFPDAVTRGKMAAYFDGL